jgi:stage V sporulation protein G
MKITEVRVKLLDNQPDKLRGFASITINNAMVVRDLKIIEGTNGLFIAMPSRKLCDRCPCRWVAAMRRGWMV